MGRFINGDNYPATGQGLTGNNMFAYCGNNPVMYSDPTGMLQNKLGDFFSKAWRRIKSWAANTFGAQCSTTVTIEHETPIIPDPYPITIKTGTTTTQTLDSYGDSSKPISVYAELDAEDPVLSSSVGININSPNATLDVCLALDDIGIYGLINKGSEIYRVGLKTNLSELKVGYEFASIIEQNNTTVTNYTNVSFNGWFIVAAYLYVTTGQYEPLPQVAYGH